MGAGYNENFRFKEKKRKYEEAISDFSDFIVLYEYRIRFLHGCMGDSYFHLGKYQMALDYLENALPTSSEGDIEFSIGNTHYELGNYVKSIEYYDITLASADPEGLQYVLAQYKRARALATISYFYEAMELLAEVKKNPLAASFMNDVNTLIAFCEEKKSEARDAPEQSDPEADHNQSSPETIDP